MNSNPLVSVIIPVYNGEKYIAEAVESVLGQTFEDYELIVVDDGSTDNTKYVLLSYGNRLKYIYKPNGGCASARNAGIKEGKGKYFAFLDADDTWLPNKLEAQMNKFEVNPEIGLVFCDHCVFNENGIVYDSVAKRRSIYEGMVFERLWQNNFVGISGVVVKRECLNKVGLFDESRDIDAVEDFNLLLRIARYYKFGFVNEVLFKYRLHGANMSLDFEKMYIQDFRNFEKVIETFPELNLQNASFVRKGYSNYHFNFGLEYFVQNEFKRARKQFFASLRYVPLNFKGVIHLCATLLPTPVIQMIRYLRKIRSTVTS